MPTPVTIDNGSAPMGIAAYDGSGPNPVPLNIGRNQFADGDGISRYHSIATELSVLDNGPMTQNGLAANTISNYLYIPTPSPFTLCVTCSAAGTLTFYIKTAAGGNTAFQLYTASGTALSVAIAAGQSLALPIQSGCKYIAIQSTNPTNVSLYGYGIIGG